MLVKALYQWQIAGHGVAEIKAQFAAMADFERCDREYFDELLTTVIDEAPSLDESIARHAVRSLDQLDAVGRAVLLLGLAELKHRADVPTKVVINEAVELTKRYGANESHRFVNAMLDKMARELQRAPSAGETKP
jgi:N utilization substance protein B